MNKTPQKTSQKNAYVLSVGCMMRDVDADKIKNFLINNNYNIVENLESAYYKIIVTCGMNDSMIQESLRRIREFESKSGITFITGCLPAIEPNLLKEFKADNIFPIKNVEKLYLYFKNNTKIINDINDSNYFSSVNQDKLKGRFEYNTLSSLFHQFEFTTRFFYRFVRRLSSISRKVLLKAKKNKKTSIRISNGCVLNCSFCGIKYAIGKLSSKSQQAIYIEYKNLIDNGFRHIFIIGDDTGSYGIDIKSNLPELLDSLLKSTTKKIHWYFQDINPLWAIKYKNELGKFVREKCFSEMLFSIQSGSDNILKKMNRNYKYDEVLENLKYYRNLNPYMRLLGNFIVGFPSESEEDFLQTIKLCENFTFEFIYIIPYYENSVSESRFIEPKISKSIVDKRIAFFEAFLKNQKTDYKIVR